MRYAYCKRDYKVRDYCIRMPLALIHDELPRALSVEACFLYSYMLQAQIIAGRTDEKGHAFIPVTEAALEFLLRCRRKKATRVLTELGEDGAGLISVRNEGKDRMRMYVKDYKRPILPPDALRKLGL